MPLQLAPAWPLSAPRRRGFLENVMRLYTIQHNVGEWAKQNFKERSEITCILGIAEEVGELARAVLKGMQGIRPEECTPEKKKDAVGDIMIFLLDYCALMEWDIEDIIEDTWEEVRKRDWNKVRADAKS